jgi:hypothetical protein
MFPTDESVGYSHTSLRDSQPAVVMFSGLIDSNADPELRKLILGYTQFSTRRLRETMRLEFSCALVIGGIIDAL